MKLSRPAHHYATRCLFINKSVVSKDCRFFPFFGQSFRNLQYKKHLPKSSNFLFVTTMQEFAKKRSCKNVVPPNLYLIIFLRSLFFLSKTIMKVRRLLPRKCLAKHSGGKRQPVNSDRPCNRQVQVVVGERILKVFFYRISCFLDPKWLSSPKIFSQIWL